MKLKRSIYNVSAGLVGQLLAMVIGLLLPRLFITNFGSETNGLISSINQIYVFTALLEAGVGTASLQALYKPLAQDDKGEINSILSATNRYYQKTALYYGIIVIILTVVYPFIVKTDIDKLTIMSIVFLNGAGGVINYLFQGKYKILLQAEGKNYITSNVTTIVNLLSNISKIILILLGFNIIIVIAAYFVFNILQMIYYQVYIRRHYKWLDLSVKPHYDAISQKSSALIHYMGWMIFSNTDVLLLTLITGDLKLVSVYVLYNMLYEYLSNLIDVFSSGFQFIIGQSYHSDRNRFNKIFNLYETIYFTLVFILFTSLYIVITPFMKLYTNGITDTNYMLPGLATCFLIIKIMYLCRTPSTQLIHIANQFKNTQLASLIEAFLNLFVSITLVYKFGIYGVLIGTIIALFFRTNYNIIFASKYILKRNILISYKRVIINIIPLLICVIISENLSIVFYSYTEFIICGLIITFSCTLVYLCFTVMFNLKMSKDICRLAISKLKQ